MISESSFFPVLMLAIFLILLNSSRFFCTFSCLFVLWMSLIFLHLFADVSQLFFILLVSDSSSFHEGLESVVLRTLSFISLPVSSSFILFFALLPKSCAAMPRLILCPASLLLLRVFAAALLPLPSPLLFLHWTQTSEVFFARVIILSRFVVIFRW